MTGTGVRNGAIMDRRKVGIAPQNLEVADDVDPHMVEVHSRYETVVGQETAQHAVNPRYFVAVV